MKSALTNIKDSDFIAGELLLFDKPLTWTSFDVVNKVRYALRRYTEVKKIKVGHSGTLDPMATGLLMICTGKMTKQIEGLQGLDKVYTGTIKLGETTPSYDSESEVDQRFPTDHITAELIKEKAVEFVGEQDQIPPMFSAIKVDGQPLYKLARRGIKKEIKSRRINIHSFEITHIEMPLVHFKVHCTKGTYIRSLAYDFGKALESGAHLVELKRTMIGSYDIGDAWNLEQFVEELDGTKKEGGIQ